MGEKVAVRFRCLTGGCFVWHWVRWWLWSDGEVRGRRGEWLWSCGLMGGIGLGGGYGLMVKLGEEGESGYGLVVLWVALGWVVVMVSKLSCQAHTISVQHHQVIFNHEKEQ
ncbi:hypothetical protein L3X38_017395 [Prunus dulcis]|uniref:Transmembrane protein n=1 Tax=Prunus dulcis TaxID=3755 RepID=A0AAD4ZA41_PRUDU|nr:hypothetical protein L3X38_017395 [Prunus dulcis]